VISVHRSADRFVSEYDGIRSLHCFSAGAHYDPANTSFHGLIGVDEHTVPAGAGFPAHTHRGVDIVSWVLEGVLRHADDAGRAHLVQPGEMLHQATGAGIQHSEVNGADVVLRFVQLTVIATSDDVSVAQVVPPLHTVDGTVTVHRDGVLTTDGAAHLYVARGAYELAGTQLSEGDSVRADEPLTMDGVGELLVWTPHSP
jgi:quercetin 2,3-dioxygenase